MKNTMKKVFCFVLALVLTLSGSSMLATAETPDAVAQAEALIQAIPDYSEITDASSDEFAAALQAAKAAILAMTELTDNELCAVQHSEDAFQAYIDLAIVDFSQGMPTEVTTDSNWEAHYNWMRRLDEVTAAYWDLSVLSNYTAVAYDPEYDCETTAGEMALLAFSEQVSNVTIRFISYLTTASEAFVNELSSKEFAEMLEALPDTFTEDNVYDCLEDVLAVQWAYKMYSEPDSGVTLNEEDVAMYRAMGNAFSEVMNSSKQKLLAKMDADIARICDLEAVSSYSLLKLDLLESVNYNYLCGKLDALDEYFGYEENIRAALTNYALFEAYEEMVAPAIWFNGYGDMNGDELVDAADALVVLKMAVGKIEMTEDDLRIGNVNGDGELNAADALLVLQYAVGKINWFPVEEEEPGVVNEPIFE